jgi:hypothetical protein
VRSVLLILLSAALTYSVSYSLGAMLLRALRVRLYRSEERFFSFAAGSACLSALVFALTAAGLARRDVFYAVSLLVLGLAVWRRAWRAGEDALPAVPRLWRVVLWAGFAAFTILYAGHAIAPETSLEPAKAGTYVQIDFGRPVRLDRVEADLPAAAIWTELHVEIETRSDVWQAGPAQCRMVSVPVPPQPRRAAVEELKFQGIGWLVCHDRDNLASDLAARWGQWGITEVARSNGYHLWRLE